MKRTLVIGCRGVVGSALWNFSPNNIGTHRTASGQIQALDMTKPDLDALTIPWGELITA